MKATKILNLLALLLVATGCLKVLPTLPPTVTEVVATAGLVTEPTDTATPQDDLDRGIVFSEVLPGTNGNNNHEFIELYNAGPEPVDLQNYTIWYRLADNQDEKLVIRWEARTEVPGYGHYLLVREGQDFSVIADDNFTSALFEGKGGLILRDAQEEPVDILGWGEAPKGYYETSPALPPEGVGSLERKPGGDAGNGVDSDNNASDYTLSAQFNPQSRQDEITPLPAESLDISIATVDSVAPGTNFEVRILVKNNTRDGLSTIQVTFPVPPGLEVVDIPSELSVIHQDGISIINWKVSALPGGEEISQQFTMRSPWSYNTVKLVGHYVESPDYPFRRYGRMVPLFVEGGAIPIETARTLTGQIVTVQGIATMYTGGYFAGSTGTKFYIDDGTGGIQVYCPDGMGIINVDIGDEVLVTGLIEVYRNSIELIPGKYPDDVEIVQEEVELVAPALTSGSAANNDEAMLGRLITVEGTVTRLEEFTYSYELDLMDSSGDTVLVYIDKESYIDPDFIEVGSLYRISGISEIYNTTWQLKPRMASDFKQIYPEEMMLEMMAQNSIEPGGLITYTLTVYNHTPDVLHNIAVSADVPELPGVLGEILDNGVQDAGTIKWALSEIEGSGGSISVRFTALAGSEGIISTPPAAATAGDYPDIVMSNSWMTFIGSGVPIWAIQGDGFSSPFVRSVARTDGVVTGIFQELQGFWIQSLDPDENPATSEGLFVFTDEGTLPFVPGDRIIVSGRIREKSGQTQLTLDSIEEVKIIDTDLPLPAAVELDPPAESNLSKEYFEALEGMLVQVTEPAKAVAPVSQYGEYVVVSQSWGIDRIMRGESTGMMIFVDDGSEVTHYDQTTLPYIVKTGDLVSNIEGPLAYTYEKYKIEPIHNPVVESVYTTLPVLPQTGAQEFSIATFNVENLFDILDPHPSDPPRPSINQYRVRLQKIAETIISMGLPTVVGLQEVENIGILDDLVQLDVISEYNYMPVLIEGLDSRGIDVAFLVRGDQASILSAEQYPAPGGLTSRPPLVIKIKLNQAPTRSIYVINNHFLSMSAGELATEPQRIAQADWNVTLLESLLKEDPDAYVAILGDLNSFYDSPPLDTLRRAGLYHVYAYVEPDIPYTYIYQGESETLDHILVTTSLSMLIAHVEALHTNADFPPPHPDDLSPLGVSDHDPLVVVFSTK